MPPRVRSNNMTFYNVYKGKFTKRIQGPTSDPEVVRRTNQLGQEVLEYHYDALDNLVLAKIEETDHPEYGKSYDITCIDGNEYCKIRFSAGALASLFLRRLENIKLDEPFSIELYYFEDDDRAALNIYQGGQKVDVVYTKENPGKLPPPKIVKINNKDTWDWTDQLNYWTNLISEINQHLPGVQVGMAESAQHQSTEQPEDWTPDDEPTPHPPVEKRRVTYDPNADQQEDDDLPF